MTTPPSAPTPDQASAWPITSDQDQGANASQRRRRGLVWAIPSAVLATALVVAGGITLHGQRAHAAALQQCEQAATQAQEAVSGLEAELTQALALQDEAQEASEVTDAQRHDLTQALTSAQDTTARQVSGCGEDASRRDLDSATGANTGLAADIQAASQVLTTASSAVDEALLAGSVNALDEALKAAQAKNDELSALVSSTEGQVSDENTRTTASQASQALNDAITTNQEADRKDRQAVKAATKALTDATTAGESARAALADSHNAWQAAQNTTTQAVPAAGASGASSTGGSSWSGTTSTGGGSSWSGSAGGYTGSSSSGGSSGSSTGSGGSAPSGGASSSGGGLSDWTWTGGPRTESVCCELGQAVCTPC